jgi:dTDP-4-dehydrorhamnose 3,5-epimerase
MLSLARQGVNPSVVDDQRGRLTFAPDIADCVAHLLTARPAYGIYNLTSAGPVLSWAEVAREVFAMTGHDASRVTGVSTEQYEASLGRRMAPRPANSALALDKVVATGFTPRASSQALREFLATL